MKEGRSKTKISRLFFSFNSVFLIVFYIPQYSRCSFYNSLKADEFSLGRLKTLVVILIFLASFFGFASSCRGLMSPCVRGGLRGLGTLI